MNFATFRFFAELNDFLPKNYKQKNLKYSFNGQPSVKDSIEAIGIPHPEAQLITVNSDPADFNYKLNDGDRICVYPPFTSIDIPNQYRLIPEYPLELPRFVLDTHLGKLAKYLRLAGVDTLYKNNYDDVKLANISAEENRILLTRDRGLLKRSIVKFGHWVRETNALRQLVEIERRYDISRYSTPFKRCLVCNAKLRSIRKVEVIDRLQPLTKKHFDEFNICPGCDRIYWRGRHYENMLKILNNMNNKNN